MEYSVNEYAKLMGVSRVTIYKRINEIEKIEGVKRLPRKDEIKKKNGRPRKTYKL